MADISKIKLPSGNVYDIKDATAREMLAGGVSFNIVWTAANYSSTSAPSTETRATIPAGVTIYYNNGASSTTGTLAASEDTKGKFYLIYSKTQTGGLDVFDEYATISSGSSYSWEKIGDTQIDLSNVVTSVTLNKDVAAVLGTGTTFTNSSSNVSFTGGTSDKVLGEDTTFTVTNPTITVTPTTTYLKATAAGATVGADGTASAITGFGAHTTDTFVKSVSAETNKKLVTTTIPNVTNVGTSSTWSFTIGTSDESETLIIGGGNSTTPTLGTAITAATGATDSQGTGASIVTGVTIGTSASAITALGTPTTATVLTGVKMTAQPTVSLGTSTGSATGYVQVATGITSASATGGAVAAGSNDRVTAVTNVGTGTAAAQTITVSAATVSALTSATTITVSKGTT